MTFFSSLSNIDWRFIVASLVTIVIHYLQYYLFLAKIAENIKCAKDKQIDIIKKNLKKMKKAPDEILNVHAEIHYLENKFAQLESDILSNHNSGIGFGVGAAIIGFAPVVTNALRDVLQIGGIATMIISGVSFALSLRRLLKWNLNQKLGKDTH